MSVNIVVPSFGESITEGTVAQWLKKDGDFVTQDETILEIESEKATQGIPAPANGVLHIAAQIGDKVAVGGVIGSIDESASPKPKAAVPVATPERVEPKPPVPVAPAQPSPPPVPQDAALSPTARRAARRSPLEPAAARDGAKAPSKPAAEQREAAGSKDQRTPMSAIRQRIAERLLTSQKATASLTTFNEIDMSAVMDLRSRYKEPFKDKHGAALGFMSFFVKAVVEALKAYPLVNSAIDGRDVVRNAGYHVGVAVSTEKGLMVPVLRNADTLSFAQIEKAIGALAVKARDGKITVDDLQGGTFTITNGGIFGSMLSTPILNYPQSAILGMHAIQKRAVVRDDQIVIRPMMYAALTYDHRLIDGRDAVLFLVRIKECIEDPQRLLLGV
jgi:2-oxoglutarate dehydrogenase E2 component (dihydrolipoamide succinyltransferase)